MTGRAGNEPSARREVSLSQAATYLGLPAEAVRALAEGGFLQSAAKAGHEPCFDLAELRAFMVWNVEDEDETGERVIDLGAVGPPADHLLNALSARCGEMAEQAYEAFADVFPEARTWPEDDRARFVDQAEGRFRAILAVSSQGFDVDEALASDLQSVGAAAAREGAPLPQLLVVLRVSRDLVVQTAVEISAELGRDRDLALPLLLSRVLPATDRLTDSLAKGYWSAVVGRQKQARARYEHVVENASDGVYELDLDGRICYANPQLGLILGRRRLDELVGSLLSEVIVPLDGPALSHVDLHPAGGSDHVELAIARPDGVRRVLHIRTELRMDGDLPVGYQGVVRDVTAAHDLGAEKERLLDSLLGDLRLALVRLADLGAGLESEGGRLGAERIRHVGTSVVGDVERLSDLTERVAQASRVVADVPLMTSRPLELARVVGEALAAARVDARSVQVDVPAGLTVMADNDGLQRVVRYLVDAATAAGPQPARLEVAGVEAGQLHLVLNHQGSSAGAGDGARLETDTRNVVRILVEAMGGRIWTEEGARGRHRVHLALPVANRRKGDAPVRLP